MKKHRPDKVGTIVMANIKLNYLTKMQFRTQRIAMQIFIKYTFFSKRNATSIINRQHLPTITLMDVINGIVTILTSYYPKWVNSEIWDEAWYEADNLEMVTIAKILLYITKWIFLKK